MHKSNIYMRHSFGIASPCPCPCAAQKQPSPAPPQNPSAKPFYMPQTQTQTPDPRPFPRQSHMCCAWRRQHLNVITQREIARVAKGGLGGGQRLETARLVLRQAPVRSPPIPSIDIWVMARASKASPTPRHARCKMKTITAL